MPPQFRVGVMQLTMEPLEEILAHARAMDEGGFDKVQNIQAAADTLLECAGLTQDEIRPVAEAMEAGGRLAAKAAVTDEILDKCKPIAGTPEDCIAAIEEYKEAGCTHVMLELWGDDRLEQLRLFSERVLPAVRG
jgi:alkanesulfonate monooxygenase SsuD/methylene tetrahydromethanopterin reductase-like flavin-dependent oxidoreductase (luciferase family)